MKYQSYKPTLKKETQKVKFHSDGGYQQLKCAIQNWREHSRVWSEQKKAGSLSASLWDARLLSAQSKTQQIFKEASSHSWLLLNSFLNPPLIFTYSSIKLRLPLQYLGDSWLLGWNSRAGLFISLRFNFVRFTHYSILSFSDPDLSSNMFAILPISANSPGMISIFSKSVIKVVK